MTKENIIIKDNSEYQSLVENIKLLYEDGKLSEIEAHQAARNFIKFTEILIKYAENSSYKEKINCDGRKKIMTNPNNWDVELDEMEDENAE